MLRGQAIPSRWSGRMEKIKTIYKYQARDPKGHKARRPPDGISILTAVPAGPAMKWAPTCLMMPT